MRIIILLDSFSLGGAEKQAILFADYLQNRRGFTVEIWAFMPGDGSAGDVCKRYNINTKVIGYFRGLARYLYPKQIWEYSKLFRSFKPDVLMGYTNQPNLLLGLVWKEAGAKYFIWGQQGIEAAGYGFDKKVDQMAIHRTPCFISNSTNGAEFLKKNLGVPSDKVHVIYNGPEKIQPVHSPEVWKNRLGIQEGDVVALMVAHIALRKDHETLLNAWVKVVQTTLSQNKRPILLLAGMLGDQTQRLITLTIEKGIFPYVHFLGNVQDIAGLNQITDIAILSSNTEGLPNSLLESMEYGIPVAGTDIPGIREAVGEKGAELLAPPKNSDALAEILIKLILDKELRDRYGKLNKQRIAQHFNLDIMCSETFKFIETGLNQK